MIERYLEGGAEMSHIGGVPVTLFFDETFWEFVTMLYRMVSLPFRFAWILLKIWIKMLKITLGGGWLFGDIP